MNARAPFPVTVAPQPREFLPGLLLRGDEANGFPGGATAMMVRRHDSATRQFGRASLAVLGTTLDLAAIAELHATTLEAIEATTFRAELLRLFGPHVGSERLGPAGVFRVCPMCVRPGRRLIRRDTVLRLVHGCVVHGIWLRHRCVCETRLTPFAHVDPFTCWDCGRDWSELPRQPLGQRDWLRQRRVVHAYEVILQRAQPGIIEVARRVLGRDEGRRWDYGWCLADDAAITQRAGPPRYIKSVAGIVANLVLHEIPPERLFTEATVGPHPELVCHNRTCTTFGTSAAIRISAHRSNGIESYCGECGSRFLGTRTILSFELDNGSPDLSRITVRCARARLADYAMRLAEAADFVKHNKGPENVDHVFHMAGVPLASHLRANRLGLVALVARRLGRPIRGQSDGTAGTLVDGAFSDRWSFPNARIGGTGVHLGEDIA